MEAIDDALWEQIRGLVGPAVSRSAFEDHLRTKEGLKLKDASPEQQLQRVQELLLAFACGQGDDQALRAFERQFEGTVESVRRRFGPRAPGRLELAAELQQHLFIQREDGLPRIFAFGGQSELSSWLRVVTTRYLLNCIEARKKEDPLDERLLEGLQVGTANPEYMLHKEESRAHFRAAFAAAVAALAVRERQILRLAFAEGLTIDDLGELYGIHRSTAFRQLQQASERLGALLRTELRAKLGLSEQEYERWCESLRSGIELSVQRHFAA
jgi:RNA polymerase sigma-70 factor, ECF subfamily